MPNHRANELLGYPPDARLLILNADDFGMYHAVNAATLRALKDGVVRSTTVMVPCPWGLHAMQLLGEHPDIAFGVHLTVICELVNYRWGPLTPREKVPSLIDEAGYFYSHPRIPEFLAQAKLDEMEVEFRAQIEAVLSAGLRPTHLDWHCLHNGGRADVLDLTLGLAREYGLALRVTDRRLVEQLQSQGLPTDDHEMVDSFRVETVGKSARYVQMLRELPAGLSEWAVHPSLGNAESQAIDGGWPVRKADYEFLISQEAHDTVRAEGIILLDYRALQAVWNAR
jgi:chitin disaccharide deacetylase